MRRLLPLAVALTLCAGSAEALDDRRAGVTFGFSGGLHSSRLDANAAPDESLADDESSSGLATAFRLGYGVSEQLMLHLSNDVAFYYEEVNDNFTGLSLSGAGATWYLSPAAPSFYLTAVYGLGLRAELDGDDVIFFRGDGASLGVGYEFRTHMSIDLTHVVLDLEYEDDGDFTRDARSTRISFWYNYY